MPFTSVESSASFALVSVITINELMRKTYDLASATRDNKGIFALCALVYLFFVVALGCVCDVAWRSTQR